MAGPWYTETQSAEQSVAQLISPRMNYRDALFKLVLPTIGIIVGLWLLFLLRQALVILFISFLIASALYPPVEWLQGRNIPRPVAIIGLYAVFISAALGVGVLCFQLLLTEGTSLFHAFPMYVSKTSAMLSSVPGLGQLAWTSERIARTISAHSYDLLSSTINYVATATGVIITFFSILILAFLMLLNSDEIHRSLLSVLPEDKRPPASAVMQEIARRTGGYVSGQLIVACAVGLMIWLGLQLLGVPYAPVLALVATVFDIIPIVGSIAASVLGVIIALGQAPLLALWTLAVYLIANQIEQNLLSPLILGRAVGISTFWVLVSILCGSILGGVAGLYIAIPVAVVVQIVIKQLRSPKAQRKLKTPTRTAA